MEDPSFVCSHFCPPRTVLATLDFIVHDFTKPFMVLFVQDRQSLFVRRMVDVAALAVDGPYTLTSARASKDSTKPT